MSGRILSASEKKYRAVRRIKSISAKIFRFFIIGGLCFVVLYPLIYMISCAFRAPEDMNDPSVIWIPRHLTLDVIKQTMDAMDYGKTMFATFYLNVGCSLVQVISCAVTGYGFARFSFRGKKLLFGIVILMIIVPSQITAIPQYMLFRHFGPFNLINNPLSMYLPALMGCGIRSGLMIFIFRQFFRGLPKEIEDAAYLDGCGPVRTFVSVMAPNAAPAFLTVFLFSLVWYWNDFYVSSTFFSSTPTIALSLENLGTTLSQTLFSGSDVSPREQIVWLEAGCLLSASPLLVMYIFLQKYFTEGLVRSGLAG